MVEMGTAYIPPKGNNNGERCIKKLSEILKEEKKMKAIDKMLESEKPKPTFDQYMKRQATQNLANPNYISWRKI
jgi:hypothetical protein